MAYSYLQQGQDNKAKEVVDLAASVRKTNPELEFSAAYALAAIPARYALERNAWKEAAALPVPKTPHWSSFPFLEGLIEYAHALGRAHLGDLDGARKAIARMKQLRDATKDARFDYFKKHLDLQMETASAWLAYGEGKQEKVVEILRRTADAEDRLGKHPVSPGALIPVREQLGGMLLEIGQPKGAQQEFEAALKIYPGRYQGLYGAARAAELAGDKAVADEYYFKLKQQTANAGDSRPELAQVRRYCDAASVPH
jgi:tetratricopeptide (TPR) repeat protein